MFAANYQYLSFKFGLTEADWYRSLGLDHLLGKVKKKIALLHPQPVLCGVLNKELCAIRDNTSICVIAVNNDIVVLINDINLVDDVRYWVCLLCIFLLFSVCVHNICI